MKGHLVGKYNIPGPRYTSYPTVPYWETRTFTLEKWKETLVRSFKESNAEEGINLYIHLPFCESLCTFCACNKHVTKRHEVERPYIDYLIREWNMYLELLKGRPLLSGLHLGGGTPTFFKPKHLKYLLESLFETVDIYENKTFSFEAHPNHTSFEHLQTLYDLGFRRVSFGVQDYDLKVQKAIHRIQSFERVKLVSEWSQKIGYESICHEFVYGLPFQKMESIERVAENIALLRPDRVVNYSYAHVPWIKGLGQRGFDQADLPSGLLKQALSERLREHLTEMGYHQIGMDHFALSHDSFYKSLVETKIHRNFMGYTHSKTQLMIALGASAISDSWYAFSQNFRDVKSYYQALDKGDLPVFRGHILTQKDLIIRRHILNLMCRLETCWSKASMYFDEIPKVLERLEEMRNDALVEFLQEGLRITPAGHSFLRNICMAFDLRLIREQPQTRLFSMTI
ncbi:oxygen-independent coproporphyrinogen III oxidase [Bacteroidetes bacterium endosymbiont of Geopemphigus sp.]|uniref:oxygen-independent coproporphyrinogen III oxidase n=1 Tax=Bacteroidetes bacterium endosymbiont of Geopemphigus sp. TaxID=2047937 RepID=UPI000CD28DF2|nr:oxygen-independent coproporphyrinogen III oxidase [Bacteroidetes bacterium endosymbiont of Geopemphigus sp.]